MKSVTGLRATISIKSVKNEKSIFTMKIANIYTPILVLLNKESENN